MASTKPTIGFVGLGAMGFGMATNLVKQGYKVKGFDVFQQSVQRFKDAGGLGAATLEESAADVDYYICMVANQAQAQAALFDQEDSIVKNLPRGATLLLCSTVPSTYAISAQRESEKLRPDVFFVDCPVSGGTVRAADGTLSIMAGASPEAIEKGRPILTEMSAEGKLFVVEGGYGQGSNMKMAHQVLAAIHILAASEVLGFAARLGLDAEEAREAVLKSEGWSWMFENRSPRAIKQDYMPPVSALTIILKDTSIITTMARQIGFPSILCSTAEQMYFAGVNQGQGAEDDAGMVRMYFAEPVASVRETLSASDKQDKLELVASLHRSIHLCAAGEAIAFAKAVKIPLDQFYELTSNAAVSATSSAQQSLADPAQGGSTMFNTRFNDMAKSSQFLPEDELEKEILSLSRVVEVAQSVRCPASLATSSLSVLLMSREKRGGPW